MATFRSLNRNPDGAKIQNTINKSYKYDWNGTGAPPSLEGTKYSRYGARPEGIGSMLDADLVKRNIEREQQNLGQGYVKLSVVGDKSKPLNIGGRLHYPNEDGTFTIIDEKYLDIMKQRETEKREYLEGIIQVGIMSDEVTAVLLGTDVDGLAAILGPNTGAKFGIPAQINGQINPLYQVDARPSALETYSETSQAFSLGAQKYKIVMKQTMPIINNLTPDKALNEV